MSSREEQPISYTAESIIGNGSFGVVFQATVSGTGETVAIKKVLQDKRFKNRELQIMKMLSHPNLVELKHCFYSSGDNNEVFLNLVLEFMPDTVYRILRQFTKMREAMPTILVKVYMFQLARSLAYVHGRGVCHRDIKPQNLLVRPEDGVLKLCDFGSAKKLVRGEPNVSYICSRYYRAPELIFGSTEYTHAIDIWSAGCVMAELMLGQPLFPGESGVDQLVEIIKVLGAPTRDEIRSMNKSYTDFKFPQIKPHAWTKVFRQRTPQEAVDLVSDMLQYSPEKRPTAIDIMQYPYFDELKEGDTKLPNGKDLPDLFNWTEDEREIIGDEVLAKIEQPSTAQ